MMCISINYNNLDENEERENSHTSDENIFLYYEVIRTESTEPNICILYLKYIKERPFNLKGGGGYGFFF